MKKKEYKLMIDNQRILIVKDLKDDLWRFPLWEQKVNKEERIDNSLDQNFFLDYKLKNTDIKLYVEDDDTLIEATFYKVQEFIDSIMPEYKSYRNFIYLEDAYDSNLDQNSLKIAEAIYEERERIKKQFEYEDKIDSLKEIIKELCHELDCSESVISKLVYYSSKYGKPNAPKFEDAINYYGNDLFENDELDLINECSTYYDTND